jgi:hypothetical protein
MDHDIGRERIQDGQGAEGRLLSASAWRGSCRGGVVVLTAASPEQAVFYDHQLGVHDASAASCMLFLPSTPPILVSHVHSVTSVVWQFISQGEALLSSRFTNYRYTYATVPISALIWPEWHLNLAGFQGRDYRIPWFFRSSADGVPELRLYIQAVYSIRRQTYHIITK